MDLIGDDLWNLFAQDSGPGVIWCASPVLAIVLPVLAIAACVIGSAIMEFINAKTK